MDRFDGGLSLKSYAYKNSCNVCKGEGKSFILEEPTNNSLFLFNYYYYFFNDWVI